MYSEIENFFDATITSMTHEYMTGILDSNGTSVYVQYVGQI